MGRLLLAVDEVLRTWQDKAEKGKSEAIRQGSLKRAQEFHDFEGELLACRLKISLRSDIFKKLAKLEEMAEKLLAAPVVKKPRKAVYPKRKEGEISLSVQGRRLLLGAFSGKLHPSTLVEDAKRLTGRKDLTAPERIKECLLEAVRKVGLVMEGEAEPYIQDSKVYEAIKANELQNVTQLRGFIGATTGLDLG